MKHDPSLHVGRSVTQRAAHDRHLRALAERQVRDLERENARLRALLKQNGIRI